ncbi:HAMP domain-containing histidine kinase [Candidatus Desantisbacteria bacterium]|nr:HAMP domain-containing histidine kinase [Candidatus Desantisbacteria bacterium]
MWFLGAFGLTHGAHEWITIFIYFREERLFLKNINSLLVIISFIFLSIFALKFYELITDSKIKFNIHRFFTTVSILFIVIYFFNYDYDIAVTFSRYLLCFPSCILLTVCIPEYYKLNKVKIDNFKMANYLTEWTIGFGVYGIAAGLMVDKGDFFPANLINKDMFPDIFIIPAEILRMVCAGVIAWASFNIIKILNQEYTGEINILLKEANKTKEELIVKTKQLEEAGKVKNKFIASITHELKTPLNAILGFSEILMDETIGPLNEKQKEYLTNMEISGKRLLKMIISILDITKIENKRDTLNIKKFSIENTILQIINDFTPLIIGKKINLNKYLDLKSKNIYADPIKIRQIIDNLLSNAIKFTPIEGKIEIRAREYEKKYDNLILKYISIEIQDNGIGIAEENFFNIFEEFVQLDATKPGSGLGLAIAKRFAVAHGGEIKVESIPGKGSIFLFFIPVVPPEYSDIYFLILQTIHVLKIETVSFFFCKINNLDKFGETEKEQSLNCMENYLNLLFREKKDCKFFYKSKGIFLVILDTGDEGVKIIKKRIEENKDNCLKKISSSIKPELEIKVITLGKNKPESILAECIRIFT